MPINLDPKLSTKLGSGMSNGSGVELPFVTATMWVVNGDAKLKQLGGASYFGGWATKQDEFEAVMQSYGQTEVPQGFVKTTQTTRDNKEIEAYTTRGVVVAPICYRRAWLTKDGLRAPEFVAGARQHVQAICYLAHRTGDVYTPYGVVMLSAKGFQAKNLLNAFGAWKKHTSAMRAKIAPNVPSNLFYLAIGTFGTERKAQMVGQPGNQSSITPVTAWLPNDVTEATLEKLFVGNEIAEVMGNLLDQAQEWLGAWKHPQSEQMGGNRPYPGGENEEFEWPSEPPAGDEIPF